MPESRVTYYTTHGDRRWFSEYHWYGLELLVGNAYVLTGLTVFVIGVWAAFRQLARRASASG